MFDVMIIILNGHCIRLVVQSLITDWKWPFPKNKYLPHGFNHDDQVFMVNWYMSGPFQSNDIEIHTDEQIKLI